MKPKLNNNHKSQKTIRKYVPTPEEAEIIKAYFIHNNYQDFNTWQQISKCKSDYQYSQTNEGEHQCKIIIKWEDSKMPIIAQTAQGKNKRKAKKKALYKLIDNLIFQGLIGYGFKDSDFVRRLPKRRKEDTSSESQESMEEQKDTHIIPLLQNSSIQQISPTTIIQNFEEVWYYLLQKRQVQKCVEVIRHLQRKPTLIEEQDIEYEGHEQQHWQDYCEKQFWNPELEDLTDILQYYQLQWMAQEYERKTREKVQKRVLPFESLSQKREGKNLFQQFYPIDKTLTFQQQISRKTMEEERKPTNPYFELKAKIEIPKFEEDIEYQLIQCRIVQILYNSILYFSYDYRLVIQLLTVLQRQIKGCEIESTLEDKKEGQKLYLDMKSSLVSEFSYLLFKKTLLPALSIEGMVSRVNKRQALINPKEPEQILSQKLAKRNNTNEFDEMPVFAIGEYVLLVSKIDHMDLHIGCITELSPNIKIKSPTLLDLSFKEKYPFTVYKLANSKIYNRLSKAIIHGAKENIKVYKQNTFILIQTVTYPLISLICDLICEWACTNETILLVTENMEQISKLLSEIGFKVGKVTSKFDERSINKYHIICSTPNGLCSDMLKNYLFSRVIIEGAHKISQMMALLAIDKGCQKLYLIGDPNLPSHTVFSPFLKHRPELKKNILQKLIINTSVISYFSIMQIYPFDNSIFDKINFYFYEGKLHQKHKISTPLIKGFPWPSQVYRFAFVHQQQQQYYLNKQCDICINIIASILQTGFTQYHQIKFVTTSQNIRMLLNIKLNKFFIENRSFLNKKQGKQVDKMIDFLTGSRFKQCDLCILVAGNQALENKHLNAALQESFRGLIVLGNMNRISSKSPDWRHFISWGSENRLVLKVKT